MAYASTLRNAVLLMSHFFNETIEKKYNRLVKELDSNRYEVFLILNVNDKASVQNISTDTRLCIYDADDLNKLGYTPIYEKLLPGSCHFPVLKFYLEHPTYAFYWFIEYDVEFTAPWNVLMSAYNQDNTDFIAPFIAKYNEIQARKWNWWKLRNNSGFPLKNSYRAFHPICRYSSAALKNIDKFQKTGVSAHSELLIPTILFQTGLTLSEMKIWGNNVRYRPLYTVEEYKQKRAYGELFHPIKF